MITRRGFLVGANGAHLSLPTNNGRAEARPIVVQIVYDTQADQAASTTPESVSHVAIRGWSSIGDAGEGAILVRANSSDPGAWQDARGTWWKPDATAHGFNPCWLGAKGDGFSDDSNAVQNAIKLCTASSPCSPLFLPRMFFISSSLFIDRKVDTTTDWFRIYGISNGGFIMDASVFLLDSNNATKVDPQSEALHLDGINFVHKNPSAAAWIISDAFLRVKFTNCRGVGFKISDDSGRYHQSWLIDSTNRFTLWQGWLFKSRITFDCAFGPKLENAPGGAGFYVLQTFRLLLGGPGALAEGLTGPVATIANAFGITIDGWYTEANMKPDFVLGILGGILRSVAITNNTFIVETTNAKNAEFWNVTLNNCKGVVSAGNSCFGRLYDDALTPVGELMSSGDYCSDHAFVDHPEWLNRSGNPIRVLPSGVIEAEDAIVMTGTSASTAYPLVKPVSRVTSGAGGVLLPPARAAIRNERTRSCAIGIRITIINSSDDICAVYPRKGDFLNALEVLPPGTSKQYMCIKSGIWSSVSV